MGNAQRQFNKEFSKATTYSMLDQLTRKIETKTQKKRAWRTLETMQSQINTILTPDKSGEKN
ncbi:MAG TPA: hypothetical protein VF199_00820 [Bacillales bacterium]